MGLCRLNRESEHASCCLLRLSKWAELSVSWREVSWSSWPRESRSEYGARVDVSVVAAWTMPPPKVKNVKFLAPKQTPDDPDEEDEDEILLVPNQVLELGLGDHLR